MQNNRSYSPLDALLIHMDRAVRTIFAHPVVERSNPAHALHEQPLSGDEAELSASLMRVNHAGEIAAQALYQGQAVTAEDAATRFQLEKAAQEESDHLAWCEQRLEELNSRPSLLNPVWYTGSFLLGAAAGKAGDKWSLGFIVETERQVIKHLENHLQELPPGDDKSRVILEQMKQDEAQHATAAINAGAKELPLPIKVLMTLTSKIMTTTARWI